MEGIQFALKKILKDRQKSMYALAKETGISYSTIHKIATKDIQRVSIEILDKLCNNLKCTPNDLIVFEK